MLMQANLSCILVYYAQNIIIIHLLARKTSQHTNQANKGRIHEYHPNHHATNYVDES